MLKSLAVLLTVVPAAAWADATTEAQLRAALQQATAQIATLEDQVANLQAAQAPDNALINSLQAQLIVLRQHGGAPAAAAPADDAKLAALNRQLAARQAALTRAQDQARQFSSTASASTAANQQLAAELAALHQDDNSCQGKNAALYKTAEQILDAYSHKDDWFGAVADRETFIGFKRVQLQNIVQDDQDRLDDNRIGGAP